MALHGQGEARPPRGLLGGGAPVGGQQRPRGVAPEVGYEGEPNVSKKEQAEYDKFMDKGFQLIYDEGSLPQLMQRLTQSGNPVEGLANVTVSIVRRLMDSAEKAGQKIDSGVLLHGGTDLMADIADLARQAGVYDYTDEEVENALYSAMDQFGTQEIERGAVDREAVAEDLQTMVQADQEGRLGEFLPGVEGLPQQGPPNRQGGRRQ